MSDGDFIISTGEQIPAKQSGSEKLREKFFREYLARLKGVPGELHQSLMVGLTYDVIPFIAIRSRFFKQAKGDFTSSLTFINGCDLAKTDSLGKALKPRAFVGWLDEVAMDLGGDALEPFWKALAKKTRTDREAVDFTKNYLLEVKEYGDKLRSYGKAFDPNQLAVYRQGREEAEKPFTAAQRHMLMAVREYAWRQRASPGKKEDLAGLVQRL